MKESYKGITPENLKKCQVFKKLKKNQNSLRISRELLDSLYNQASKLGKIAEIRFTLPISDKEFYAIDCNIKKFDILKGEN